MTRLHPDELAVDVALVRRLVDRAFPQYSGLPLSPVEETGSSNRLYRLGTELVVRLPRRPGGGATVAKEARWLPVLAPFLTARVPTFLGVGNPDLGYPELWALTDWLEGRPPSPTGATPVSEPPATLAADLARFVTDMAAIEVPASARADASLSGYRGGALIDVDPDFRACVEACRRLHVDLDLDAALRVWDEVLAVAQERDPVVGWYHGDLLAENLLVDRGRLSAVLDFGNLAVGDPAVDLVVAWELLDDRGRDAFRRAVGADAVSWCTSRGWALFIALVALPYYATTMPRRCATRLAMARTVLGRPPRDT